MLSLAEIAQLVEHFTRNEGVVGSSPIFGFDRERIKKRFCEGRGVFFVVTIHSHFTHMRKNSRQSRLPMLRILIFCLCG